MRVLVALGLALGAAVSSAPADAEVVHHAALPLDYLGPHLEILRDVELGATLTDVERPPLGDAFEPTEAAIPSFGVGQPLVWARFTLANRDARPRDVVVVFEYAVADRVELHYRDAQGGEHFLVAGDSVVDSPAALDFKQPAFPLTLPPDSERTYYLRVETTASQTLAISVETDVSFAVRAQREQLLFGLLFGALGLFILYTASLGLLLRSASAGWFSLYMICFGALVAVREGHLRLLLGDAGVPWMTAINLLAVGLLFFFGAKLLRDFLSVSRISRRDDRVLATLQWGALAWIPPALTEHPLAGLIGLAVMGVGPLFSTTLAFRYWAKGVPNARYFALGWAFAHANALIDTLYIAGLIGYEPYMQRLLPFSLALAMGFFAVALIEQAYDYQVFARVDPMTGLANRRHFDQHVDLECCALSERGEPLSLAILDVDEFKRFNDHYGHTAGDRALTAIAPILKRVTRRRGDLAARYGGEEFVLVLSRTDAENAQRMAEEVRAAVEALAIPHENADSGALVTVSVGVATAVPESGLGAFDLIDLADEALYRAKALGRNRVAVAAPASGLDRDEPKPDPR